MMGNKSNKVKKETKVINTQLEQELIALRQQLEQEKTKNSTLERKLTLNNDALTLLSHEQIKQFVESLLNNEQVNIVGFPDVVERKIYVNILSILMEILKESVKGVSIEFMGHEIKMYMQPKNKEN